MGLGKTELISKGPDMLRIGLLGASRIAPGAVIAPAALREDVVITAVAARDPARAAAYASDHNIAGVAEDYAALVARDDVDLVYNGLPPSGHLEWTLKALDAGKAVLCEKPFAMNAGEARTMVDAAASAGRPLIEAFHYRYHQVMRQAVDMVRSGALGTLHRGYAMFDAPIRRTPDELRWRRDLGGGALMDLGCYPVHALRSLFGEEPKIREARATFEDGVDARMNAALVFSGGIVAEMSTSMTADAFGARLTLGGSRGRMEIINFLAPQRGCRFVTTIDGVTKEHPVDGPSTYEAQLDHVVEVMTKGTAPLTGGADSVGNMAAIDAIYAAAGRT